MRSLLELIEQQPVAATPRGLQSRKTVDPVIPMRTAVNAPLGTLSLVATLISHLNLSKSADETRGIIDSNRETLSGLLQAQAAINDQQFNLIYNQSEVLGQISGILADAALHVTDAELSSTVLTLTATLTALVDSLSQTTTTMFNEHMTAVALTLADMQADIDDLSSGIVSLETRVAPINEFAIGRYYFRPGMAIAPNATDFVMSINNASAYVNRTVPWGPLDGGFQQVNAHATGSSYLKPDGAAMRMYLNPHTPNPDAPIHRGFLETEFSLWAAYPIFGATVWAFIGIADQIWAIGGGMFSETSGNKNRCGLAFHPETGWEWIVISATTFDVSRTPLPSQPIVDRIYRLRAEVTVTSITMVLTDTTTNTILDTKVVSSAAFIGSKADIQLHPITVLSGDTDLGCAGRIRVHSVGMKLPLV